MYPFRLCPHIILNIAPLPEIVYKASFPLARFRYNGNIPWKRETPKGLCNTLATKGVPLGRIAMPLSKWPCQQTLLAT